MAQGSLNVLVTGGAGFIGSHLVDALISNKHEVHVLDDLSTGQWRNISAHSGTKKFHFARGSILSESSLKESMKGINTVFHEAATVSVIRSVKRPDLVNNVNVRGTMRLLDSVRRSSAERIVFASSAAVYGSMNSPPLREDFPTRPDSPYGASKAAAENYCVAYSKTYGLKTVVLRYANVYGPRRSPAMYSGVMMKFAETMTRGRQPLIFGDGGQTRDFVFVSDVVQANILAMQRKIGGGTIINVGTGRPTAIKTLARLFAKNLRVAQLSPKYRPARKGEVRSSYLAIEEARQKLHFIPKIGLNEGLRRFLTWYSDPNALASGP